MYSDDQTEKELERLIKSIKSVYSKAYVELDEKVKKYFESFKKRDEEMRAAIEDGSYPIPIGWTADAYYKQWRQNQIGRGERWEKMRDDIVKRISRANEQAAAYINESTPGIYALNYNYEAYRIEGIAGGAWDIYDENTVKSLVKGDNHVEFRTLSVNLVRDYAWNKKKIDAELLSGILQGKSIKELSDGYMHVMMNNRKAAIRNARTAVTSAQNGGRQEGFRKAEKMGIKVCKRWVAMNDSRTRDSHAHLDGVMVKQDEKFPNGLMYPGDPSGAPAEVYNCRCTMVGILPKYNKDLHDTGNTIESYKEWLKDHVNNKAKIIEALEYGDIVDAHKYTKEQIISNLNTSPIGRKVIKYIEENNVNVKIYDTVTKNGERGQQIGNNIEIYSSNIKNELVAGQTLVHEATHSQYDIGNCQHAEAICFAHEKMHKEGRDYLTLDEWNYCKNLAISAYPELEWEDGGYGEYDNFNFVRL